MPNTKIDLTDLDVRTAEALPEAKPASKPLIDGTENSEVYLALAEFHDHKRDRMVRATAGLIDGYLREQEKRPFEALSSGNPLSATVGEMQRTLEYAVQAQKDAIKFRNLAAKA